MVMLVSVTCLTWFTISNRSTNRLAGSVFCGETLEETRVDELFNVLLDVVVSYSRSGLICSCHNNFRSDL